jgi:hypothetical protein
VHGLQDRFGHAVSHDPSGDNVLPLAAFRQLLDNYVEAYNFERAHSGIGGLTPAAAWNADTAPVAFADRSTLRDLFLSDPQPRVVGGFGVRVGNVDYTAPELNAHVGSKVMCRYLNNERAFVDCYTAAGEFICTAVPHEKLTEEQRAALRRGRQLEAGRVQTYLKEGKRRAAERARAESTRLGIIDSDAVNDELLEHEARTSQRIADLLAAKQERRPDDDSKDSP